MGRWLRWLVTGSLLITLRATVLVVAFQPAHIFSSHASCAPVVTKQIALFSASTEEESDIRKAKRKRRGNPSARSSGDPRRNVKSSSNKKGKEASWLRWMDARLEETPVGELPPKVIKQMRPIMHVYAKQRSTKGAENANRLMTRLIKESEAGNADVKLSTKICNAVLSAWARSGSEESSERATKLLIWMSKNSKEGTYDVKPSTVSFSTVIDSWARSGADDAAQKAEALLMLMEKGGADTRPNTVSFNSCIHAHARSEAMDKAVKAEALVNRMEDLYEAGNTDVRPDVWTYQSLLSAWSTSKVWGAPQRGEEILRMMDSKYKAGDDAVKPNAHCFTASITAWSKSFEKDKARSVYRILQYMNKLYADGNDDAKPNVVAYTAALNACAYPEASEDEEQLRQYFDIATLILEELRISEFGSPSYLTYATFLQVCASCLADSDERDRVVRRIFDECRQDGQVGDAVIQKLKKRFPSIYHEFLEDDIGRHGEALRSKHLPKAWRRNVAGERHSNHHPKRKDYADIDKEDVSKLKVISRSRGARGFYSKEIGSNRGRGRKASGGKESLREEGRKGDGKDSEGGSGSFDEATVIL